MNSTNCEFLKILERDESLTPAERETLRKLRRGEIGGPAPVARILRRAEAAARLSCTVRTIDRWCALGMLPRMKLPGFSRASGIPESAVAALIASGTPAAAVEG